MADKKPATDILPPGKLEELEAAHGEILAIKTKAGAVAFKCPTRAQYRRHLAALSAEKDGAARMEELVVACCVHPSATALTEMIERRAGIVSTCYSALLTFAGVEDDKTAKKYETGSEET